MLSQYRILLEETQNFLQGLFPVTQGHRKDHVTIQQMCKQCLYRVKTKDKV